MLPRHARAKHVFKNAEDNTEMISFLSICLHKLMSCRSISVAFTHVLVDIVLAILLNIFRLSAVEFVQTIVFQSIICHLKFHSIQS